MIKPTLIAALAATLGLGLSAAQAQDHLKVGVIGTLSGPPAVLGQLAAFREVFVSALLPELAQRPVAQRQAFDLHVEHTA